MAISSPPMSFLDLISRHASQITASPCWQTHPHLMKMGIQQRTELQRLATPIISQPTNPMFMRMGFCCLSFWRENFPRSFHSWFLVKCQVGCGPSGMTMGAKIAEWTCFFRWLQLVAWPHRSRGQLCGRSWRCCRKSKRLYYWRILLNWNCRVVMPCLSLNSILFF